VDDYETWLEGGVMPTLNAFDSGDVRTTIIIFHPHYHDGARVQGDTMNTLTSRMGTGGTNVSCGATVVTTTADVVGSLQARDYKGVGNQYVEENKLVISYPIQGTMIGRSDTAGPQGKGYGEENELCERLSDRGLIHVAATGLFVEHIESVSFGAEKQKLIQENLAVLSELYPHYNRHIEGFLDKNPLRRFRWLLDLFRISRFNTKKIVICNYERLHYFNENDFVGVICDESSILKNFDGKIKNQITSFIKKIPYRFLSTATPSPNDFIELGTSSEALGYMGYMDMLTKFFKNNQNSVDSNNRNIGEKFYLKPHAEKDFFAWVNQWAIMIKMPSDLGFSNDRYNLPELILNKHIVANQSLIDRNGQFQLFTPIAKSMTEVRHEQKQTEIKRCEKAIELAHNKTSVYWCNTNNESSILKSSDKNAVEIIGSQSIDKKEEILLAFANGEIKRLITKAKMTSMGLNWQHCNHSVFFPTWSYEQYYQAIRRFWRFGQKNNVIIDMVISDGQTRVIEALEQKTQKAIELHKNLTENVNKVFNNKTKQFNQTIIKPKFI
jgi:hypothetical protein